MIKKSKKIGIIFLAAIMLIMTMLTATGCDKSKWKKRRIMMAYLYERYDEKFTFEEYLTFNDGLTIFDMFDTYVYGMTVRNSEGQHINVTMNWRGGEKPDEVICYDNYIKVKYLDIMKSYIKDIRDHVFDIDSDNPYFSELQMDYVSIEAYSSLAGDTTYEEFVSWYIEYPLGSDLSFYVDALSNNLDDVYELELERLEQFKQELKNIDCPVSFYVSYYWSGERQYYGTFAIDENWNYSEIEILD